MMPVLWLLGPFKKMHPRRLNLYIQPLFLLSEALSLHSKMISMNYFGQVVYEMEKTIYLKGNFENLEMKDFLATFWYFIKNEENLTQNILCYLSFMYTYFSWEPLILEKRNETALKSLPRQGFSFKRVAKF